MRRFAQVVLSVALGIVPGVLADPAGRIDWDSRTLRATGVGPPDLNAPSIPVARLSAERAALATAQRNLLDALSAAPLQGGGTAGALLQKDEALRAKVQAKLRTAQRVKTHYFSDGGISLELQFPLDQLPAEIAGVLKAPPQAAATPAAAPAPSAPDAGSK
ncbi:MAG TPA: hypothetical protein VG496_18780 [Myxococcales bacterium]|nr:hypothetical protein [Myxococcales bacterium]